MLPVGEEIGDSKGNWREKSNGWGKRVAERSPALTPYR